MKLFKRISLFLITNLLIVATLSIVLNLLGIQPYLSAQGINFSALLGFCMVWGFGGAFISLAMSRISAKWMMGVEVIDPQTPDPRLRDLVDRVHAMSRTAGLTTMPEVGIYEGEELNAFATGPTRNRSLVAVSTGLLQNMNRDQVDGVLGHEIAHIANGDMVTMTLLQGVVNVFVMFIARVVAYTISQAVNNKDLRPLVNMISIIVLDILLGMLGMMVVAAFSRYREFRADRGGADLAGREKMISALKGLQLNLQMPSEAERAPSMAAFKISGKAKGFLSLFATHPPLEVRIFRLEGKA